MLRAPMAWQDNQTQVAKHLFAIHLMDTTTNGQQRCYTSEGTIAGTKMRRARHVENEHTWQRYVEVVTHRQQEHGSPKGTGKGSGKGPSKCKGKKRTPDTVCDVEKGKLVT